MPVKRIKTGIKGFDELIEGGFPQGSCILLTGTPGTGKTIFGLQYLYNGAVKFKESGLYVSMNQPVKSLINQANSFGWDLEELMNKGIIQILYLSTRELDQNISQLIVNKLQQEKIKRAVIDSLSVLAANAPMYRSLNDISVVDILEHRSFFSPPILGDVLVKKFIYTFIEDLRKAEECTTILISESSEKGDFLSRDTVSEFACDSIIQITFESMGGEFSRSLLVRKMRETHHNEDIHPLEIGKKGLIVHTLSCPE